MLTGTKVPGFDIEVYTKPQRFDDTKTIALTPELRIMAQITRSGDRAWITHGEQRLFIQVVDAQGRGCLFYQSFSGAGGKRQGAWFPSGGMLVGAAGHGIWVVKGNPKKDPGAGRPGLLELYRKVNAVLPQSDEDTDVFALKWTGFNAGDLTYEDKFEIRPTFRVLTPGRPDELQKQWNNWAYSFWALHGLTKIWGPRVEMKANPRPATPSRATPRNNPVYGKLATVFHGSRTPPEIMVPVLLKGQFSPGQGDGGLYGLGLYAVYEPLMYFPYGEPQLSPTFRSIYGPYVYKLLVNLDGMLIFDADVAKQVYGSPLSLADQAKRLNLHPDIVEEIERLAKAYELMPYTSYLAKTVSEYVRGLVKGLVYTGVNDGRAVVVYDPATVTPVSYIDTNGQYEDIKPKDLDLRRLNWSRIETEKIKQAKSSFTRPVDLYLLDSDRIKPTKTEDRILRSNITRMLKQPTKSHDINGDVVINTKIPIKLPDNLSVDGNVNLEDSQIIELPAGLRVSKKLTTHKSLTRVPADLSVQELDLSHCHELTELPEELHVRGDLNIEHSNIKALPKGLVVDGSVNGAESAVIGIGPNVRIRGDLNLNGTRLHKLPADLRVGGNISLVGSRVVAIPHNLTIKQSLLLARTHIRELPAGLRVPGVLDLGDTPIETLPKGLFVGDLNIQSSNIQALPADIKVTAQLRANASAIKEIPSSAYLGGYIDLSSTGLKGLPEKFTVNGKLDLAYARIEELPEGLTVRGDLDLRSSHVRHLPKNLRVEGDLKLQRSRVTAIPDDAYIGGNVIGLSQAAKSLRSNPAKQDTGTLALRIVKRNAPSAGLEFLIYDTLDMMLPRTALVGWASVVVRPAEKAVRVSAMAAQRGYGPMLYELVATLIRRPLLPSGMRSRAALNFWSKQPATGISSLTYATFQEKYGVNPKTLLSRDCASASVIAILQDEGLQAATAAQQQEQQNERNELTRDRALRTAAAQASHSGIQARNQAAEASTSNDAKLKHNPATNAQLLAVYKKVEATYKKRYATHAHKDDIASAAVEGLVKARTTYDPSKGEWGPYAARMAEHQVNAYLQSLEPGGRAQAAAAAKVKVLEAAALSVPAELRSRATRIKVVSTDAGVIGGGSDEGDDETLGERIEDENAVDSEQRSIEQQRKSAMQKKLQNAPLAAHVYAYLQNGKTREWIAKKMGISSTKLRSVLHEIQAQKRN